MSVNNGVEMLVTVRIDHWSRYLSDVLKPAQCDVDQGLQWQVVHEDWLPYHAAYDLLLTFSSPSKAMLFKLAHGGEQ